MKGRGLTSVFVVGGQYIVLSNQRARWGSVVKDEVLVYRQSCQSEKFGRVLQFTKVDGTVLIMPVAAARSNLRCKEATEEGNGK